MYTNIIIISYCAYDIREIWQAFGGLLKSNRGPWNPFSLFDFGGNVPEAGTLGAVIGKSVSSAGV